MHKKTLMAATLAAAVTSSGAFAADAAPAETSPHTLTANVGIFSQYIFRGLSQTNENPALQGGFDYAYALSPSVSLYAGTWHSNISWLRDSGQYSSSSLESDFYGGAKGTFGESDFTWDAGVLQYVYTGSKTNAPVGGFGGASGNTTEVYGALGWKWLSAKVSYVVSGSAFAVYDAQGTYYVDLSAAYPIGETGITLLAHWGDQKYEGTDARNPGGASNDTIYSYQDYKLGASYDLGKVSELVKGTTVGAYYTNTSGANNLGYGGTGQGGVYPKTISGDQWVVYLQKTF